MNSCLHLLNVEKIVVLSEEERAAIVHALQEDFDRIEKTGGNRYGPISLETLSELIHRIREAQSAPLLVH